MNADGTFGLFIPAAITGELSVELAPAASTEPWFTFNPMALSAPNQNLGTVTLPTYQVPQADPPVTFMVRGSGSGAPIVGAALRAITVLEPDASTTTPPGDHPFLAKHRDGHQRQRQPSADSRREPDAAPVRRHGRAAARIALRVHLRPSSTDPRRRRHPDDRRSAPSGAVGHGVLGAGRAGRRRHREGQPQSRAGQDLLRRGSDRVHDHDGQFGILHPAGGSGLLPAGLRSARPGRRRLVSASTTSS